MSEAPLFVYGTLKPGQLAFQQVEDLLADRPVPAQFPDHCLRVRDGLPGVVTHEGGAVDGFLLEPRSDSREEFDRRVRAFEPDELYSAPQPVQVLADGQRRSAVTHMMKSPDKGRSVTWPETSWGVHRDPLFRCGLPAARQRALLPRFFRLEYDPDGVDFWACYLPVQGLMLSLCGMLERYLTLCFGVPDDQGPSVSQHLRKLGQSAAGLDAVARAGVPLPEVRDSRRVRKASRPGPENAWSGWYTVRSNAIHRGKGQVYDLELVQNAFVGLHNSLRALLAAEVPDIVAEWRRLEGVDDFFLPDPDTLRGA